MIVVEHDEETIEAADYIVDMGLGAGLAGGEVYVRSWKLSDCVQMNFITGSISYG